MKDGTEIARVPTRAIGGTPHIEVPHSSGPQNVALERIQTRRRRNTLGRKQNHRPFRWYNDYRVPDDPRIPARLRGGEISIKLEDPDYETNRVRRAENLHSIAPGEPDWERLFDLRNPTESINNWVKDKFHGKKRRAPAVGARRQHVALLGAALYSNFAAQVAQADRLRRMAA